MRRPRLVLLVLIVLAIAAVILRLGMGPTGLVPDSADAWGLRIGRVLSGAVVGAALAIAGVLLQALLRNPLASPDLIGPASGAGFAVTLSTYLTQSAGVALSGESIATVNSSAALIGALAALAIVYSLSQKRGSVEPAQLILVGVVVSIMFGAGTMFLMHLMPDRGLSLSRWTIGSLSDDASRGSLTVGACLVLLTVTAGVLVAPSLDASALSEDESQSLGVPVARLRLGLFLASGALTAAAVVLAGPIGFVGLIAPHLVRAVAGPGHKTLVVGSAICGLTLIVAGDCLIRVFALASGRMPIGVLTAVLGGVTFIWMTRRDLAQVRSDREM